MRTALLRKSFPQVFVGSWRQSCYVVKLVFPVLFAWRLVISAFHTSTKSTSCLHGHIVETQSLCFFCCCRGSSAWSADATNSYRSRWNSCRSCWSRKGTIYCWKVSHSPIHHFFSFDFRVASPAKFRLWHPKRFFAVLDRFVNSMVCISFLWKK